MTRIVRAAALAVVALMLGGAAVAAPSPAVTASYQDIVKAYFNAEWKAHPTTATATGVHTYDGELDDVSAAAVAREIARLTATKARLLALDGAQLSPMDRDDRDVLVAEIGGRLFRERTVAGWRHNPGTYVDLLTYAAFQLIERNFAPLPERMKNLIARENAMPAMLATAKHNLTAMPRVFIRVALKNLDGGISVLSNDVPKAFTGVHDSALQRQLAASTRTAVAAAKSFKAWLIAQQPHAHGSFMLGEAGLQRLLDSDMVDVPVATVLAAGEAQFAKDHAAFIATERLVDPQHPSQALAQVEQDHPANTAELLQTARADLSHLQSFIEQHHIVDLPSQQLPVVAETPAFARAVIFGETDWPGPLETHATKVYYFITPPEPSWPKARQEKLLAYWNRPMLQNLTVHESLPGHFTQYLFAHAHPQWSLVRKMASSYSTTEGWAHYSEQMMLDQGLNAGMPKYRLIQLSDALLRDCRLIAAIKMHEGLMTVAEATAMMETQCFVSPAAAPGEAERGTADPGYYSYTLGKLMILKLRADMEKKEGKAFNLTRFHDAFLSAGLVPIAIIRREMGVPGPVL